MPPAENNTSINQPLLDEIVSRLNEANNVLVTVSNNPSVDQLAACIALTVALNKKDKHATAVFSGAVPSTIEFLEPDKTIEKTTDSLRDFIISLDKAKADKLRYKVEDEVVKIFITPYRTSITENDLQFSQGDFNVDAVVAIGVHNRSELDGAIVAHGRILHDATVISVNNTDGAELGSLHWYEKNASSLSEMTSDLIKTMDSSVFDEQIANALLTGIVAETDRFKSEKATPHTMTVSGILMAAGASPQLVSSKLEQPPEQPKQEATEEEDSSPEEQPDEPLPVPEPPKENDGVIQIDHDPNDIHIDDAGKLKKVSEIIKEVEEQAEIDDHVGEQPDESLPQPEGGESESPTPEVNGGSNMIYEPPTFGGQLTANTQPVDQQYASNPDPLAPPVVPQRQILNPAPPVIQPPDIEDKTLTDIEKSVNSPHINGYVEPLPAQNQPPSAPDVPPVQPDYARDAVQRAVQGSTDYRPEPIQSLGASPLADNLNPPPANPPQDNGNNDTPAGPPPPPVPPPLPPAA